MQRNTLATLITATLLTSASVSANVMPPKDNGFSGDIGVSVFYTSGHSQFNMDDGAVTDSIYEKGEKESDSTIAPLGNLNYTFNNKQSQLFLGASRADVAVGRLHLEFGYRHWLANSTQLSFSVIPGIVDSETWQDPYVANQTRVISDTNSKAFRFQANNIVGSGVSWEIAAGEIEIENEKSGTTDPSFAAINKSQLDRNADVLFSELGYAYMVNRGLILRAAIDYLDYGAKGDAMAYQRIGAEASVILNTRRSSIVTTFGFGSSSFDQSHPIYNKTRDDSDYSIFVAYEYREPLGWKNWSVISLIGYNETDSNIDFYDEDSLLTSVGMNYRF
ncbi:DUF2860 family protein [Thaumasiovibrio subtropicus]|uniref:DUF2860 family protein n=1 Tax=Thaumasiovibrio subtropicus TaxID=1891207 RepID=UPI000B355B12|nr:DUF2860 family protein [Thaumasiovibrio subtropicus]